MARAVERIVEGTVGVVEGAVGEKTEDWSEEAVGRRVETQFKYRLQNV